MTFHCRCGIKEVECDYPSCVNGERDARKSKSHLPQAVHDVLAERRRQIEVEGWTPEHDDSYKNGELSDAAASYALNAGVPMRNLRPPYWPWEISWWKPGTPRRDLVKAGALILAEIERLDRSHPTKG